MTQTGPRGGGGQRIPPPAGSIAVQLTRGTVVMSEASLAALGPDMCERLFGDVDVVTAEDALAELEEDD